MPRVGLDMIETRRQMAALSLNRFSRFRACKRFFRTGLSKTLETLGLETCVSGSFFGVGMRQGI